MEERKKGTHVALDDSRVENIFNEFINNFMKLLIFIHLFYLNNRARIFI